MNPELPPDNRAELEAKVTALLLGELTAEEAAALRQMISQDAALARLHERLKATLALVRETAATSAGELSKQPAPLKLSPARREALLAHFKTIAPKEFAKPRPRMISRVVEWAAVAVILLIAAGVFLPKLAGRGEYAGLTAGRQPSFWDRFFYKPEVAGIEEKPSGRASAQRPEIVAHMSISQRSPEAGLIQERLKAMGTGSNAAANSTQPVVALQGWSSGNPADLFALSQQQVQGGSVNGLVLSGSTETRNSSQPASPPTTPIYMGKTEESADTGAAEQGVTLNLRGVSVDKALAQLAESEGLTINRQASTQVGGTVDLVSDKPLNKDEIVPLYNKVLADHGLTALRDNNTLTIMRLADAQNNVGTPVNVITNSFQDITRDSQVVTEVIPVHSLNPIELNKDFSKLGADNPFASFGRGRGGDGGGGGGGAVGASDTSPQQGRVAPTTFTVDPISGGVIYITRENNNEAVAQALHGLDRLKPPATVAGNAASDGWSAGASTMGFYDDTSFNGRLTGGGVYSINGVGVVPTNGNQIYFNNGGLELTAGPLQDQIAQNEKSSSASTQQNALLMRMQSGAQGMTPSSSLGGTAGLGGSGTTGLGEPGEEAGVGFGGGGFGGGFGGGGIGGAGGIGGGEQGGLTHSAVTNSAAIVGDVTSFSLGAGGDALTSNDGSAVGRNRGRGGRGGRGGGGGSGGGGVGGGGGGGGSFGGDFTFAIGSSGITSAPNTPVATAAPAARQQGRVASEDVLSAVQKEAKDNAYAAAPAAAEQSFERETVQRARSLQPPPAATPVAPTELTGHAANFSGRLVANAEAARAEEKKRLVEEIVKAAAPTDAARRLLAAKEIQLTTADKAASQVYLPGQAAATYSDQDQGIAAAPAHAQLSGTLSSTQNLGMVTNATPILGDLPVLGTLFRNADRAQFDVAPATSTAPAAAPPAPALIASPAEVASIRNPQSAIRNSSPAAPVASATPPPTTRLKAAVQFDDAAPLKPAVPPPTPQPEVQARDNAFSTFSLNVSDVSFKLAAASLQNGSLPDASTVRSEEFINTFDYRDPEPAASAAIGFAWERAGWPFAHNRDLLRFSVKTAALGRQAGRPLNLVLLLDKSGSMERADRVAIIREALRVLATQLQPQDKLSVVVFARTARLWADGVSGSQAGELADALEALTPEGGTNLEEAMRLAYEAVFRHYLANGENRVVLLTDGAANLGDVDPENLKKKVEASRTQGIALDCFGVGWEDYNDNLLEVLSRAGGGRYGFINTPEEAATGFAGQLAGALRVAASDVKVQVEFNPARVISWRQIGYAKDQLKKEQFRDNTVKAAQIGAAESGNALYTVEINPAGEGPVATVYVRYRAPGTESYYEHAWAVPYDGAAVPLDQASPAMRLAAAATAFSEWLATSPYAGGVTLDQLLGYMRGVPEIYGADERPKLLETMLREAKSISGK